jgi:hypothetical protein
MRFRGVVSPQTRKVLEPKYTSDVYRSHLVRRRHLGHRLSAQVKSLMLRLVRGPVSLVSGTSGHRWTMILTYHKLFQACLKQFVVNADTSRVLDWRQGILHHIFNVTIHIYLLQCNTHRTRLCVCEHNKFGIGRGFVVMELVLRRPVGKETALSYQSSPETRVVCSQPIIFASQLSHHIPQGEDSAENELSIIFCTQTGARLPAAVHMGLGRRPRCLAGRRHQGR